MTHSEVGILTISQQELKKEKKKKEENYKETLNCNAKVSSSNIIFNKVRYHHAHPYGACNCTSTTCICTADIVAHTKYT